MATQEYLEQMRERYSEARSRKEKKLLLDEICATCRLSDHPKPASEDHLKSGQL